MEHCHRANNVFCNGFMMHDIGDRIDASPMDFIFTDLTSIVWVHFLRFIPSLVYLTIWKVNAGDEISQ